MDDSVFSTIGKLYLEVVRLQQIAEAQNKRIQQLENTQSASLCGDTKQN